MLKFLTLYQSGMRSRGNEVTMSLLIKGGGGITKLSELIIDADKNWQVKGITNLKEVATAMAKGDFAVRNNTILARFAPGPVGQVLISGGPGNLPAWAPAPGPLTEWFPAWIYLEHAEAIVEAAQSHNENAPITSSHAQACQDAPADMIKRLTPAIALTDAEAIVAADQSHNENSPVASECALEFAVGGAKLDDGGVFTDYTVEINEATPNDVQLLPVMTNGGLVVDDAFYFGLDKKWGQLWLDVGVGGVGNYALAHEYWDGDSWELLTNVIDNTSEFTISGKHNAKWTVPGDWALKVVDGDNLYWIRARVTAVLTYTTQPLGTQAWCEVIV